MSQYAFHLSLPAVFSEDIFAVSACNQQAHQWVTRWPDWPVHALYLHGPRGSGKTHLGHIWAQRAKAQSTQADWLDTQDLAYEGGNRLVEDIHALTREERLLHLFNLCREHNSYLLLTGCLPIRQLPFTLPDLTSRLQAIPAASIAEPDDQALAAVLRKQFADRQLKIDDEAVAYLLPRIDRSFLKISELISSLDQAALAAQKKLTIPFIRRFLP